MKQLSLYFRWIIGAHYFWHFAREEISLHYFPIAKSDELGMCRFLRFSNFSVESPIHWNQVYIIIMDDYFDEARSQTRDFAAVVAYFTFTKIDSCFWKSRGCLAEFDATPFESHSGASSLSKIVGYLLRV